MKTILVCILLCVSLSACTFYYTQEYVVESIQESNPAETEAVFNAFRNFLVSKGLNPINYDEKANPNHVSFRIGGSDAGFGFRHDWHEILELTFFEEKTFHLRLVRITHHPAGFTDEYLKKFAKQTEDFIREATSKPVRLKLIPSKDT